MEYRFYIYKQNNFTNFNKYSLSEYSLLRQITQNSQWKLKPERDRDSFPVIRWEFDGDVTVSGDDFTTLIALEGSASAYAVVIHRNCSGVWSEFWKGWFSYFDYKVDLDKCHLSFQPTVWDKYSPVFDELPIERNIFAADTGRSVNMNSFEWATESITDTSTAFNLPYVAPAYIEHSSGGEYFLYQQIRKIIMEHPLYGNLIEQQRIFKREIGYSTAILPPSASGGWVAVEEISTDYWKWARPIGNFEAVPPAPSYESEIVYGMTTETLNMGLIGNSPLNHTLFLKNILEYYASIFDLTYVSSFFNDSPCPMGGYTLTYASMQHLSDMRDTFDPATKGLVKLKDLLTWIRDTFNAYWFVDSNGDFRIEHRKYFDYGLSYTETHVIELDLISVYPVEIKHLNRYEWNKPEVNKFEKLIFPFSYFIDWTDAQIEYLQGSIINTETKEVNVEWGTDAIGMYDGKEDLPKKGWVLLDILKDDSNPMITLYKVRNEIGALTGISMQNARFSSANILKNWWTFGRLLPQGMVNGVLTDFEVEKLRKQVELNIPMCCQDIDLNGLFRTELGDGWMDSGEYEAKTGTLKLNLIYE